MSLRVTSINCLLNILSGGHLAAQSTCSIEILASEACYRASGNNAQGLLEEELWLLKQYFLILRHSWYNIKHSVLDYPSSFGKFLYHISLLQKKIEGFNLASLSKINLPQYNI